MTKIINHRDVKVLSIEEGMATLSFLKPNSGEHENHLIVIYEDAYGDFGSSMMHKDTIIERYSVNDETITEIFNTLNNETTKN